MAASREGLSVEPHFDRKDRIDRNRVFITDNLEPDRLILPLKERGLIRPNQWNELHDLPTHLKTEKLIDLVYRGSPQMFQGFIEELKKDNQHAVAEYLMSGQKTDKYTRQEVKERIHRNRVYLIQHLNAAPMIDYLQSRGLISTDIYDSLEVMRNNPRDQVISLCEVVGRSSKLYEAFIEALRDTNQHAVADRFSLQESSAIMSRGPDRILSDVKDKYHLLIDNIMFHGNFLTLLESRKVITMTQVDELMAIPARRDRAGQLLRLIEKGETGERTRGLVSALHETEQPHLARLIEERDDSDILPKDVKESIHKTQVYEWIREAIKSHSLASVLFKLVEDKVITSSQSDFVQAIVDPEEQCRRLMDIIICRPQSIVRQGLPAVQGTTEVGFSIPPMGSGQWSHQDGDSDSAYWSNPFPVMPDASSPRPEEKRRRIEGEEQYATTKERSRKMSPGILIIDVPQENLDIRSGAFPLQEDLDDDCCGMSTEARKCFQLNKSVMDQKHMDQVRKGVADLDLPEWEWNEESIVVKKTIGKGRHGNVTVISHPQDPGKDIIVKSLLDSCVGEFVKELKLICSLKHKNIIDLYAYSINPTHMCLLEEYMVFDWSEFGEQHQSHDLDDFICTLHRANQVKEFNGLSSWIWHVAIDVAKGISFIHDRGVAHRDLKLQNILVAKAPSSDRRLIICKLCDFGEARAYSVQTKSYANTATFRTQRGTWSYMAPEIVLEEIVSADHLALKRMDVWSYGICILFLLNPDLRNDPFHMNFSTSKKKTFVSEKHFMSQLMTEKEIPQPSEEYTFLREQYGYIERLRLMCLDYDPARRPTFKEIVKMLNAERKKEIAQNDIRPIQIAANTVKLDISDRVQDDTSAKQVLALVQEIDDDQPLVKLEIAASQPVLVMETTPLQTFRMAVLMSGRVISSSMDSEEIIAILYHERILPLKNKQQMETFPEDSIEKSEAILNFLRNLPEKTFAHTEKVLARSDNGQKYLVDLWQAGKTPIDAPPHWYLLHKYCRKLPGLIEPNELLQCLFQQNILNTRDYENIGKCLSKMDKVEKLLKILRRKPFLDFTRFIEALKATNQEHVADIITDDDQYPK